MPSVLDALPTDRLLLDVSLWSANLADLGVDVARISPLADLLHIDASDAVFVPQPLFFPDLVRAIRPHTDRPLHVHQMAHRPARLVTAYADAGADLITVHAEADAASEGIAAIHAFGLPAGLALTLATDPARIVDFLTFVQAIVLVGTPIGTKATSMDPAAPARLRATRHLVDAFDHRIPLLADGGIRRETVPLLAEAGADGVVPGSLLWAAADRDDTANWIRNQPRREAGHR